MRPDPKQPLRILASSHDYRPRLGGVATCTYELCRALSERPGIRLRLLAPRAEGDEAFDAHGKFETIRVKLPAQATSSVLPLCRQTARQLQSFRPHAILDFLWMPSSVVSYLLTPQRKLIGAPYFVLVHAMEILESDRDLKRRLRQKLTFLKDGALSHAAGIFAVSRFTGKLLEDRCGIAGEKIRVVANGVDPARFTAGARAGDLVDRYGLRGKKVFITVSRLDDYKGVDRAIASLRLVVPQFPDLVYLVCGQGGDEARLHAIARHYRMQDHVRFAGAIEADRLVDYYNLADCHVLLSREDWEYPNVEGFGLVFLESGACGVPSIAGRSGGVPDAVVDGETGWLVDPTDDHAIAEAMLDCLRRPEERRERGRRARQRILDQLTWRHMAESVLTEVRSKCAASAELS